MYEVRFRPVLAVALVASLLAGLGTASQGQAKREPVGAGNRYVVVFGPEVADPKAKTNQLEHQLGFKSKHRYGHALHGFSALLTADQVQALRATPGVAEVTTDRVVHAAAAVPLESGDSAPTGVRRIEAGSQSSAREASTVNVAVIDTGIDLSHPDLNAVAGPNCVGASAPNDDNGHGTHVAGTIAARNNGAGVTGVAPGTRLFAAKALDSSGSGTWSQIICAIDWATATRTDSDSTNDIAVANMSLGGTGDPVQSCSTTSDPLHKAICSSTAAGVTYVVAAGNDGWDFDYAPAPDVPAAYPQVLTVTAVTDSDGQAGGLGSPPACRTTERDDRYASFSNYAATAAGGAHTIAAPGTCIKSTWRGGGYGTISGTSMATPHVAGLVALCLGEGASTGRCAGKGPAEIIQAVRGDAKDHTLAGPAYGFAGDPMQPVSGRTYGYLAWLPSPDTTVPTVTKTVPASGATAIAVNATIRVTFSEPMNAAAAEAAFSLERASDGLRVGGTFSWSGTTMTFDPQADLSASTPYEATVSTAAADAAGNVLESAVRWSFTTAAPATTSAPASVVLQTGTLRAGDVTRLQVNDNSYYQVSSTTSSTRTTSWYGEFTGVPKALTGLKVNYSGKNSRTCTQTVALYRWSTAAWIQLDSRSVGTTETGFTLTAAGTLGDFVSGTSDRGQARVRIRCTTKSGSFHASGDLLTLSVTA